MRVRSREMIRVFHRAARDVPAYKDFLGKNKIDPDKIKTLKDFQLVPPVSKKNYLRKYELVKLCHSGTLRQPLVFTSTSGSTGEPIYFPRGENIDWQSSVIHELFLKQSSYGYQQSTLVIICFGMGVWIGGLITYQAFRNIQKRGHPISIITPGINKDEIFKSIKKLGSDYYQIIICGYPPFVKDLVDESVANDVDLKQYRLRFIMAAETFSEEYRDYIAIHSGIKNVFLDTMNIYGSADLGTMAFETPISILLRRLISKNQTDFSFLFSIANKFPTLTQYCPHFTNFEEFDGEILLTGENLTPLIRYSIGDSGGTTPYSNVAELLKKYGHTELEKEIRKHKLLKFVYQLPFVHVYERSDHSVKLYGAIIYPEPIRHAMLSDSIQKYCTGKFAMLVRYDDNMDERLEVNVELKPGLLPDSNFTKQVEKAIIEKLSAYNAEYRNNYNMMPQKVTPQINIWPNGDNMFFAAGIKQKWVRK